jgi:microcystin degradation protein MlrC
MRVAIGAVFTESNHLVGRPTTLADFERTELRRGDQVLAATDGALGGALHELRARGAQVEPLLFASAVPGGPLTLDCYRALKSDLLARLKAALPVDGVLMPLHGAAAVEKTGDLDGDLIESVRSVVGPSVPLVATLDLHAHVTAPMVENADALVAWETYPHRDTFSTGQRGARLLMDILEGKACPAMAMGKVPVIVGGYMGSTDDGPFAALMRETKALERQDGVLSTSLFLVQPHLDLPNMGGGGLVITDGDIDRAVELAAGLAGRYWAKRFELETQMLEPSEAIAKGMAIDGTVLLLETSDCAGGGASGDSAWALRAMLEAGVSGLAMVVDPEAAAMCHAEGVGARVAVTVGHKVDTRWGSPLPVDGRVEKLTDGRFVYTGGIWGGLTGEMGPSARVRAGSVDVLVATHATYDWADEQYGSMDMDTGRAKFIVVKNPMNYRVGYDGRFKAAFVLDTPGPTIASLRKVPFQELRRPYFPVDEDIPGLKPEILRNR